MAELLQFSKDKSGQVWDHWDDPTPKVDEIWTVVDHKKSTHFRAWIYYSPQWILSKRLIYELGKFRMEGSLRVYPCRLCYRGSQLDVGVQYYVIYGRRVIDSGRDPLKHVRGDDDIGGNSYYCVFLPPGHESIEGLDLMVGSGGEILVSETAALAMIEIDELLAFDPVLIDGMGGDE